MSIELLELDRADQLSVCRLSLLLGLKNESNIIEQFLKFSCQLITAKKAIICFHEEPYFWYLHEKKIYAIEKKSQSQDLISTFQGERLMDVSHINYQAFSQKLDAMHIHHTRAAAVDLLRADQQSIGVAIFFDEENDAFDTQKTSMLADYCDNFIQHIELRFNFEELTELYEQQRVLNFSKTKFFSIISHDLRAPFHGLLGFSEVLAKEREALDPQSVQDIADYLYETSQSTYNLLESLLNWAMAEGGRFVCHPVNFNLKQATTIVMNVLNTFALKKNIELIDQVPAHLNVHADINMMTSVIQNLVSNALKFTQTDGTGKVFIKAVQIHNQIEIQVQDTGLGLTQAQMDVVFQPRITVSFRGTQGEKGAGLGLTLCKRFVDLNHGEISVVSKEGKGTTFKVLLPKAVDVSDIKHEQIMLDVADVLGVQKTTAEIKVV